MSTALEKHRPAITKPPVGLMLSIGEPKKPNAPGRPIDHFRPKEGELAQFADAAARFTEVYGETPQTIDDVYFLSNEIDDVLDIRLRAWGAGTPKIVGLTNYATLPKDEFQERAYAFDDEILYFPRTLSEVPKDRRDTWQGEPIRGKLEGPDDPRIPRFQINLEATLSICLPQVMGVGTVATLTTKGRVSTRNLYTSVRDQYAFFQGQLVGPPFRLSVRPKKSRYFNSEKREYLTTTFYEIVLDTALNISEIYEAIRERRVALGGGSAQAQLPAGRVPSPDEAERAAIEAALRSPAPPDEEIQIRDEPVVDRPSDATLNRIAQLERDVGVEGASVVLRGVFGVDSAEELNAEDAARYEELLARSIPTVEGEVVDEGGGGEELSFYERIPADVRARLEAEGTGEA